MRNPFKRDHKEKPQPTRTPLHMPHLSMSGQPELPAQDNLTPGQPVGMQPQPLPAITPPAPAPRRQPQVATEQTMEYLKKVEPDDILELLYPRLVTDQKTRLEACTAELEEIDQELTRLHLMRDDVLNTQNQQQANGVTNF